MKTFFKIYLLSMGFIYGCNSSTNDVNNSKEKVEKAINEWIKLNADHPDSYTPASFSDFENIDFSISSDSPSIKYYRITHTYQLKSKGNKIVNSKHHFVLNGDFKVAIISKDKTPMLQSVPPSIFEWAISFGENFKNVYYGGLDSIYYFRKFQDYKKIGGNLWNDFNYLDDDCFQLLIKSIKHYPNHGIKIKRIIKAIPEFETSIDKLGDGLNELGMTLSRVYGKNPQTNFAVIQRDKDSSEIYMIASFDKINNVFQLKEINKNNTNLCILDTSYISTDCFKYILKY